MTKQEEIREELIQIILRIRQYLLNTEFCPEPFTEPMNPNKLRDGFSKEILEYLYSQGVVIKVGEFDILMDIPIYPEKVIGGESPYEKRTPYMEGWNEALIKVGKEVVKSGLDFVAVAPLIKEAKDVRNKG